MANKADASEVLKQQSQDTIAWESPKSEDDKSLEQGRIAESKPSQTLGQQQEQNRMQTQELRHESRDGPESMHSRGISDSVPHVKFGPDPEYQLRPEQPSKKRSKHGRLHVRSPNSDTEDISRTDAEQRERSNRKGIPRQRNHKAKALTPRRLDGTTENVNGAVDLVQNTHNNTMSGVSNAAERTATNSNNEEESKKSSGKKRDGKEEQLRLRLDINLDVEVQLKAKIHGDLTLGLL